MIYLPYHFCINVKLNCLALCETIQVETLAFEECAKMGFAQQVTSGIQINRAYHF